MWIVQGVRHSSANTMRGVCLRVERSVRVCKRQMFDKKLITVYLMNLERFLIECCKTKTKPLSYLLDHSANLKL